MDLGPGVSLRGMRTWGRRLLALHAAIDEGTRARTKVEVKFAVNFQEGNIGEGCTYTFKLS